MIGFGWRKTALLRDETNHVFLDPHEPYKQPLPFLITVSWLLVTSNTVFSTCLSMRLEDSERYPIPLLRTSYKVSGEESKLWFPHFVHFALFATCHAFNTFKGHN